MTHKLITYLMVLFFIVFFNVYGDISELPDYTFMWNKYKSLMVVDGFVVGCTERGLVVSQYDLGQDIFVQKSHFLTVDEPVSMNRDNQTLAVKTSENKIYFFDLSNLPNLTLISVWDTQIEFEDYVFDDNNILLSAGFDGLWNFSHQNFGQIQFVDSSFIGVYVTQLELRKDTLYVLDEYNGIIRYDISGNNLNSFVDYLYVPFSVKKFCLSDDRIILSVVNRGVLIGEFDFEHGIITDSIPLANNPISIFETDIFLVFVHNRGLDLVHKEQHDIYDFTANDILPNGDICQMHAINYLFLPNISGGFSLYDIDDVDLAGAGIQGLKRFGEIKDIMFFNNKFYTAGEGNPIDIYSFDFDNKPVYDTSIAEGLRYVSSLESLNDDLFALYRLPGMIAIYSWVFDEGPAYIKDFKDSIEVDPLGNPELYISDKMFNDSLRLVLMIKDASIDVFTINNLNKIEYRNNYRYTGRIEGFVLDGNKLFVATNKKLLYVSEIDSLYNLNSQPIMSLNMDPDEMIYLKGSLAIFGGTQIQFFNYSDISNIILDTTLTDQVNVLDAVIYGDSLFTVTNEYIGIFDITSRWPILVDSGGYGGKMISVTDNMIAVSNGFSLDFYDISEDMPTSIENEHVYLPNDFELGQNYPNPFNSSTIIQFSIEKKSDVKLSIYNTLGRKIITVLDSYLSAGRYNVEWDGSRKNGDKVASGIYFYRLSVNSQIKSKKMLLLK
ncbi:MAG: hypothetical protein DRP35_06075 [Candidatus Zixiibacteriota bacterium]|nr:MAG: hypothetical protein DRP35_06075 [candidate division Zixibacteria bacterium]